MSTATAPYVATNGSVPLPTVRPQATLGLSPRAEAQRLADDVLDVLPVTDRVYHHLDYFKPLVVELAARLKATHQAPARVLIIGPDSLLPLVLLRMEYHVDLWHFLEGHLTDEVRQHVRATVTPSQLVAGDLPLRDQKYDAIVVPLVLESLPGDPTRFLAQLRRGLTTSGSLILATTNVSRLDLRLLSAAGRSTASAFPKFHVSLSFPPLPKLRYYHRADLLDIARESGLWVRESTFIMAHQACSAIDPFPPVRYASLQLQHRIMQLLPSTRHAILLHLAPRVGDELGPQPGGTSQSHAVVAESTNGAAHAGTEGSVDPRISAVVTVQHGGESLRQTLDGLIQQDYPQNRIEVLVVHDGQDPTTSTMVREMSSLAPVPLRELVLNLPEGPVARNAAMAAAAGDICVHTDDSCHIPLGWLRTVATAFDDATGALTGPVIETAGGHPEFFVLPGTRLGWDHQGLYPICNVAYRRRPALAAGGFREIGTSTGQPQLHWDTELAWRLRRFGWNMRFLKDMFLYRTYAPPAHLAWIGEEWRAAASLPAAIASTPELRRYLPVRGHFAGRRTLFFDLLLLGTAAMGTSRKRRWLLLCLPWCLQYWTFVDIWPATQWPSSARRFIALGARHVVWFGGLTWGSLKARALVL